jgi:L-threonine kinase
MTVQREFSASVTTTVPGTCGELVQGWHPRWEKPILVSCPIALYSRVTARLRRGSTAISGVTGCAKLGRAARLTLDYLEALETGAHLTVQSQLLPGRGMASSTADIVAGMSSLALALGQPLSFAELARLACEVEPSDSVMFSDLTILAYRDQGKHETVGPVPMLPLIMLDPGQVVDTITFNRHLNLVKLRHLGPSTLESLALLRAGTSAGDPATIAAAATLSATNYQSMLFNPILPQAQQWAAKTGALGIVRAHSGSLVGLIYPHGTVLDEIKSWLGLRFSGSITSTQLTRGGFRRVPAAGLDTSLKTSRNHIFSDTCQVGGAS